MTTRKILPARRDSVTHKIRALCSRAWGGLFGGNGRAIRLSRAVLEELFDSFAEISCAILARGVERFRNTATGDHLDGIPQDQFELRMGGHQFSKSHDQFLIGWNTKNVHGGVSSPSELSSCKVQGQAMRWPGFDRHL